MIAGRFKVRTGRSWGTEGVFLREGLHTSWSESWMHPEDARELAAKLIEAADKAEAGVNAKSEPTGGQ